MFSFRKNTFFSELRSKILLDESNDVKEARKETAIVANQMKIACGATTQAGFTIAFFAALRTIGARGGLFSSLLALTTTAISSVSYDAMHVAKNVEELCENRDARVTASKSSKEFIGQLTKDTFFYAPLFRTALVRQLDNELPKEVRNEPRW